MTATLDRDLLARIGTVLYGEHWQAPMARALGKSTHTVSRWATGSTKLPHRWAWEALACQLASKTTVTEALIGELTAIMLHTRSSTQASERISQKEKTT